MELLNFSQVKKKGSILLEDIDQVTLCEFFSSIFYASVVLFIEVTDQLQCWDNYTFLAYSL